MSPIITFILIILLVLAVLDLIVGVSNDAINFLNSSMGSKVAPLKVILAVASVGIMAGVVSSSGMMEVARNGVFHPAEFTFTEVMFLFVGMMLSDVILLNTFNRLGLPTSTTVSLIFELLGSAVAIALFKIWQDANLGLADIGTFINSGKAMLMISGILISVAISFVAGSLLMFLSRLLFSFKYAKQLSRFGAAWCGIAFVGILYFAIFKGMKSSGIIDSGFVTLIHDNLFESLMIAWVAVSAILFLLQRLKIDILKITILSGTFALALAFAGNDLVNFIGVPLAGFDSYMIALQTGDMNMTMEQLATPTNANTWLLIGSGVIMVITLFMSKSAMNVAATELKLSSVNKESERFNSTPISRSLVRLALSINDSIKHSIPNSLRDAINMRFIPSDEDRTANANYDKIRAVVNLTAAATLICIGTSLKLPLSTTYVVFMVAMGSSLADRAWGRDSAVYRVTGVMVVIAGWFLTALVGFSLSLFIGMFLMWGKGMALAIVVLLCAYLLIHNLFCNKAAKDDNTDLMMNNNAEDVLVTCTETVCNTMAEVSRLYNHMLVALFTENRKALKETMEKSEEMYRAATERKYNINSVLVQFNDANINTGHFYVQVVDYLCEVTKALLHCTRPAFDHINNNHRGLSGAQIMDLKRVNDGVDHIFDSINEMLRTNDFSHIENIMGLRDDLFNLIADCVRNHIRRLKENPDYSTRASALFLNILNESKNMVLQARNLIKSQSYFIKEIHKSDD